MDIKQDIDIDPSNLFEFIKTEPELDPNQTKQDEYCPRKPQTIKNECEDVFESQTMRHVDRIKEEMIQCEMPEIEGHSDFLTKIDHDIVSKNVQSFPIKQELENTIDVKIIDIKQEVSEYIQPKTESELLTFHCNLPTLKMENIDYPDYYDLGRPCSGKSLKKTTQVILKKRRYPCPICQKNFPSKLRSTHTDAHFKKSYLVCQFCGKILKKIEIFQHFLIHAVKNRTKNNINDKPLKFTHSKEQKRIDRFDKSFDTCSKRFDNKSHLKRHLIIHNGEKQFKCDICFKTFAQNAQLWKHFVNHSGEKSFKCDVCSKGFNEKYHLQRHLIIHSGEKPFKCNTCSKEFTVKSTLRAHLKIHSDEKPFECDVCSKRFKHKYHLNSHLIIHSGEKRFKCDICYKGFTYKGSLQNHLILHTGEKPFKCDICPKRFSDRSSLKRHLVTHRSEQPFECNICSKFFTSKALLQRHLIIHSGEKPFKCDVCSKRFNDKSTLNRHLIIHSGEKRFMCDICSKGFTQKSTLKNHLIIHSGVKPFKCDICPKRFNDRSSLRRHIIIHHSAEKPIKCEDI